MSERERLAAEYAMGLLEAEETARCERRLGDDPRFAALVEEWRTRLCEIDASATPVAPNPALWARIVADLGSLEAPARPTRRPSPAADRLRAWWGSLDLWRGIGLVASAAVLLLAVGTAHYARQAGQAPVLVAVLLSDQDRPAAVVNAFRDGRTELLALSPLAAPEGKSLQVWTLWDRARGPVSVGLLDRLGNVELSVDGLPVPAVDQLFEVTLEPAGGSPTGRPTGPILMKGNASRTGTGV